MSLYDVGGNLPKNPNRRNDRIERGVDSARVDNPRIVRQGEQRMPQAEVRTRSYAGSDFRDFPRLVVQLGRPRPQARGGGAPRDEDPSGTSTEPKEGFARPLRGMGVNRYEGLRDSMKPEIQAYRGALRGAYADGTLSEEETKGLRQQRRGLRQNVRDYGSEHPLQMGLGSRVKQMAQGDREGGIGESVREMKERVWPKQGLRDYGSEQAEQGKVKDQGVPSLENIRQLQEAWKSGTMTPEQVLEALGFTGRLPNG